MAVGSGCFRSVLAQFKRIGAHHQRSPVSGRVVCNPRLEHSLLNDSARTLPARRASFLSCQSIVYPQRYFWTKFLKLQNPHWFLLEDYGLLMLLDRDTQRNPRTRVLAVSIFFSSSTFPHRDIISSNVTQPFKYRSRRHWSIVNIPILAEV